MALPLLGAGTLGQIFTPREDGILLTTGSLTGVLAAWCHSDGVIVATYPGAGAKTITLTSGDQWGFPQGVPVSITSGTWSFM